MDTPVGFAPLYVRGGSVVPMLVEAALPSAESSDGESGRQGAGQQGLLELLVAPAKAGGVAAGELFLDDFEGLDTVGTAASVHLTFTAASSKLVANVSHVSTGAALEESAADSAARSLFAVDTVKVLGVRAGSVSKVSLSVAGAQPVAVPSSQWSVGAQGLTVSGLLGASIKSGSGGVAFELSW